MSYKKKLALKIEGAKKLQADFTALGIISTVDIKTGEISINMSDNPNFGKETKEEDK